MVDLSGRALLVAGPGGARSALKDVFRALGYQTLEADGVEDALDILSALGLCELGVVDGGLGSEAGLELITRARMDPTFHVMRFVIVLSELRAERVMEALTGGFDDYLLRPVTAIALARKLRDLGLPARDVP